MSVAEPAVHTELVAAAHHAVAAGPSGDLASTLYERWYSGWGSDLAEPDPALPVDLVQALRAAHAGSVRFEPGWIVRSSTPDGRVVAVRGPAARVLDPADYVAEQRPGLPPRPGEPVRVTGRRDSTTAQAGYWVTWGADEPRGAQVRLYWNAGATGAPGLVHAITAGLAHAGVAYTLKVPAVAEGFRRHDAVVLYLESAGLMHARQALLHTHAVCAALLEPAVPALTRRLARGLGLADEPTDGESFGTSRCRTIAGAMLPALRAGERDVQRLAALACERFAGLGHDPERLHLNPWTEADHAW